MLLERLRKGIMLVNAVGTMKEVSMLVNVKYVGECFWRKRMLLETWRTLIMLVNFVGGRECCWGMLLERWRK